MRRSDREITNLEGILDVIQKCKVLRIAMKGEEYPYVVPVSFGAELVDNEIIIYFHSINKGMKVDLLSKDPKVCVEGDVFMKNEEVSGGLTARYESFIGFGICGFVYNYDEKKHGMEVILNHYGYAQYPIEDCIKDPRLLIGKITLERVFGKHNL